MRVLATLLLVPALLGCRPDGEFSECDPLDPSVCALPFPSSFFLREADTPTGYQVAFGAQSLPTNRDYVTIDPALWNEKDGFATVAPLLTYFRDVSLDGTVGHDDIEASLLDGQKTILLRADTGERVPHFVELDMTAEDPDHRLLKIWPVVPLEHATRYIVGIRDLQRTGGGAVAVSEAFQQLQAGKRTGDWDIDGRLRHYDDVIFPALEDNGFERDELQLAWDFVTVSRQSSLGRMDHIREDALSRVGAGGPGYSITSVEDADCAEGGHIARTVIGKLEVPLYTVEDGPGTILTRDAQGMPYANGETTTEFIIRIPCSVAMDPQPSFILQYGHGMLGNMYETRTGWLSSQINENRWVAFGTSWTGMRDHDAPRITLALVSDPTDFAMIPERSHQGFMEKILALRLMRGPMVEDEAVMFPNADGELVSVLDPERFGFYGNSQGAILGGAYVAASPDLERAVFGVGGMPYAMLLTRSANFDPFFRVLKEKFTDHRDITLLIGLFQMLWEPAESAGWVHAMSRDPSPGTPAKSVLKQVSIYDAQVTTLGAHIQARGYDAVSVAPAVRPIWGLQEKEPPFEGSALVEWLYVDTPDEPIENLPPDKDFDTHECVRREPAAREQIRVFLETGVVEQFCEGPCEGVQATTCG